MLPVTIGIARSDASCDYWNSLNGFIGRNWKGTTARVRNFRKNERKVRKYGKEAQK